MKDLDWTYAPRYPQRCCFWTGRWGHTGGSPFSLARRTLCPWFPTRMSNLSLLRNPVNLKQVCRFQMHRVYSHLDVALVVMCMQVQFELWHDKESYCYFCKHNISPMKARTSINYTPSLERSWREQVLIVSERALCAHNTPYYIPLPNDPRNTQPYFWENRPQLHVTPRNASTLQLKEVLGGSASAESVSRNARSHIFSTVKMKHFCLKCMIQR